MKTLLTIGPIHVPFFGTMIILGVLAALGVLHYESKRKNINFEKVFDLATTGFLGGILGARIGYVLFYNLGYYIQHPIDILKIYDGGLSIHGGIVGGSIIVLIFLRKNKEFRLFQVADLVAPAIILAQAIGRVGCDVYGKVMSSPAFWGIPINGQVYHPAQVYEFILDYIFFLFLWKKRKKTQYEGQLFGYYIIGFAVIRSIVELARNNPQVFGFLSISHILSIAFVIVGILWIKIAKKLGNKIEHQPEDMDSKRSPITLIIIGLMVLSLGIYYGVQLNF